MALPVCREEDRGVRPDFLLSLKCHFDKKWKEHDWRLCGFLRLELSIDNLKVTQRQSSRNREEDHTSNQRKFKGCIANLYTRRFGKFFTWCSQVAQILCRSLYFCPLMNVSSTFRPEQSVLPVDLSSLSLTGDVVLGLCALHPPPQSQLLPEYVTKRPQTHRPVSRKRHCFYCTVIILHPFLR